MHPQFIHFGRRSPLASSALALLTLMVTMAATPGAAADGATLRLFHGPDDTGSLTLKTLEVTVDGAALPVQTPTAGAASADGSQPIYIGTLAPGHHKLAFVASLEGDATVFTYTDGYRFKMRSQLDLEVLAGESVELRSSILPQGGMTAPWQDRYALIIKLTSPDHRTAAPVAVAAAAAAPDAEPAPASKAPLAAAPSETEPVAAPAPARAPQPAPAALAAAPAAAKAEPKPAPAAPAAAKAEPKPAPAAPAAAKAEPKPAPAAPAATEPAPARAARAAGSAPCVLDPVRFGFDKATLTADAHPSLDRFAACLAASPVTVRLEGSSDPRGNAEYNRWLAWDRAAAVSAYLQERGIPAPRLLVRVRELTEDCSDPTEACFARLRRVEAVSR